MFLTFFLFPRSGYLATRWWHRLALVIFWLWFALVAYVVLQALVFKPFADCIRWRVLYESGQGAPATFECGSNAFDYVLMQMRDSSASEFLIGTPMLIGALYLAFALPALIYRLLLYVAKGSSWKDSLEMKKGGVGAG